MITVIVTIHILLTIALVIVILLQRSEGGALGLGGGGMSSFLSGRAVGNILTRLTAIFAIGFFTTSMVLAILISKQHKPSQSLIVEKTSVNQQQPQPLEPVPAVPMPQDNKNSVPQPLNKPAKNVPVPQQNK